jgi:undecaprenyl-diphosphatase
MSQIVHWLIVGEQRIFSLINQQISHFVLDRIMMRITHLGGATFTILFTLSMVLLANDPWNAAALHALIALAVSHIPVAVIKKGYPRLRPYLVIPETKVGKNALVDHSFPSGHTTAIFSIAIPFVLAAPWLALICLPLAAMVGLSRIYLGLHYPSDVMAGCLIGTLSVFLTAGFF